MAKAIVNAMQKARDNKMGKEMHKEMDKEMGGWRVMANDGSDANLVSRDKNEVFLLIVAISFTTHIHPWID